LKPVNVYKGKLLNIAKLILVPATVGFILYKLFIAYDLLEIIATVSFEWSLWNSAVLLLTLLLMPFNWWLETRKWHIVMQKHEAVTNRQSWQSVCAGIVLSIITPNQVGDIVGKAIYLQSFDKIKGAVVSLLGGLAQTIASVTFGLLSIWWLAYGHRDIPFPLFIGGYVLIVPFLIGLYYVYFHIQWIEKLIRWKKIQTYVQAFTQYTVEELRKILLLSLARFCVFSFQYFLLLRFFNVGISLFDAMLCISSIFLVQGFLPSFILIQIGVRGAAALFFFGLFSFNSAGILLAAYGLWIINMMLPAIPGLYYLLKLKWSNPS
jgi:hypothetical protein